MAVKILIHKPAEDEPEFMPMLGVIDIKREGVNGVELMVCSPNQLDYFASFGWVRRC